MIDRRAAPTAKAAAPPKPALAPPKPAPARSAPSPLLQAGPPAVRLGADLRDSALSSALAPSGGEPLSPVIQTALQGSLRTNLRSVRVHTDTQAHTLAVRLSARAVTFGNHIFLGPGEQANDLGLMAH